LKKGDAYWWRKHWISTKKIGLRFNWIEFTFNGNGLHIEGENIENLLQQLSKIQCELKCELDSHSTEKNEMHIGVGIENLLMNMLKKKITFEKTSI